MKKDLKTIEEDKARAKSLIQLSQLAQAIENQLIENNGELTDSLMALLAELENGLATKTDSYGFVIRKLESEAEFYNYRATKLAEIASHMQGTATKMKERAKLAMIAMGINKLEGDEVTITLSTGPGKVEVVAIDSLPKDCVTTTVNIKADKEKIGRLLRDGVSVPGAVLDESWTLRIKP